MTATTARSSTAATEGLSLGERTLRLFLADRRAQFGLGCVLALIFLAVFAPFLAENKPILLWDEVGFRSPLLATFNAEDWRFFLYGMGSLFIILFRKHLSVKVGINLVVGLILFTEVLCANWTPLNDTNDYRTGGKAYQFQIMPPIPYSPVEITDNEYEAPSWQHLFGTDALGRDLLSRLIHGSRPSLLIGFVAQGIALVIGCGLGAIAGYYRGWTDMLISRVIEVFECFPTFFLIITIIAFLPQPNLIAIMAVIGVTTWTSLARLVRGEFLKLRARSFTQAALAAGAGDYRVITKHIFPNTLGPILVSAAFGVASAILVEAALSFLGFGVPPPEPTWGSALSEAREAIDFAWWLATFPGLAIFATITAYNLLGEALRDAIDPTSRRDA